MPSRPYRLRSIRIFFVILFELYGLPVFVKNNWCITAAFRILGQKIVETTSLAAPE